MGLQFNLEMHSVIHRIHGHAYKQEQQSEQELHYSHSLKLSPYLAIYYRAPGNNSQHTPGHDPRSDQRGYR